MKFGVYMFPTDYAIDPVSLGRAAEGHGFESLFVPEHTHNPEPAAAALSPAAVSCPRSIPTRSIRSSPWAPWPPPPSGSCSAPAFAWSSSATPSPWPRKSPVSTSSPAAASSSASAAAGTARRWKTTAPTPTRRWKVLRERIEAMQQIWTEDAAEYHGEFVDFDPIWQWPKPIQKPHPPVIIGGDGANTLQRVVRYGDGWMPIGRRADFKARIDELNQLSAAAGRADIPVTIFGAAPKPEVIDAYAEAGVERLLFHLPPAPRDEVLPLLEQRAELVRQHG